MANPLRTFSNMSEALRIIYGFYRMLNALPTRFKNAENLLREGLIHKAIGEYNPNLTQDLFDSIFPLVLKLANRFRNGEISLQHPFEIHPVADLVLLENPVYNNYGIMYRGIGHGDAKHALYGMSANYPAIFGWEHFNSAAHPSYAITDLLGIPSLNRIALWKVKDLIKAARNDSNLLNDAEFNQNYADAVQDMLRITTEHPENGGVLLFIYPIRKLPKNVTVDGTDRVWTGLQDAHITFGDGTIALFDDLSIPLIDLNNPADIKMTSDRLAKFIASMGEYGLSDVAKILHTKDGSFGNTIIYDNNRAPYLKIPIGNTLLFDPQQRNGLFKNGGKPKIRIKKNDQSKKS